MIRMESSDLETARGTGRSLEAVVEALARAGVEIDGDTIRLLPKPKPRARR
jgi:hypothetical protein